MQNKSQAEEQRGKSLPAQGTTMMLSLIRLNGSLTLFFPAQTIQGTKSLPSSPCSATTLANSPQRAPGSPVGFLPASCRLGKAEGRSPRASSASRIPPSVHLPENRGNWFPRAADLTQKTSFGLGAHEQTASKRALSLPMKLKNTNFGGVSYFCRTALLRGKPQG